MIMLILIAIVMVLSEPLQDLIGSIINYVISCIIELVQMAFAALINCLPVSCMIGKDMYDDEFVVSILNYGGEIMPKIGIVMLVIIAMWQISKTFLSFAGLNGEIEEPWKVGIKIFIFAALVRSSYGLCQFIITGPVDKAVTMMINIETKVERGNIKKVISSGTNIKKKELYVADNFSENMSKWNKKGLYFAVVKLLIIVVVDYKIFMFVVSFVQKYVNMIIYILLSPVAFACGVSRATSNVLKSWTRLFAGGIALQLFQIALLRIMNAYGDVIKAAGKFSWTLIFVYMAVCLSTDKIEEILAEMGLSGGIKLNFSVGENFRKIEGKILGKALKEDKEEEGE